MLAEQLCDSFDRIVIAFPRPAGTTRLVAPGVVLPNDLSKRIVKPILLEVIVQTADDARAAEAGGADRLEVVRDINRDGLTPSIDVVRSIQAATRLPLRVMVRESATFTVAGATELRGVASSRGSARSAWRRWTRSRVYSRPRVDLMTTCAVLADLPTVSDFPSRVRSRAGSGRGARSFARRPADRPRAHLRRGGRLGDALRRAEAIRRSGPRADADCGWRRGRSVVGPHCRNRVRARGPRRPGGA